MDRYQLGQESGSVLGNFRVDTTQDGGHSPEFWAGVIMDQLVHVSDQAPPVIRDQALAYRDAMAAAVLAGVKSAIRSNHTTLVYQLRKAGMNEAAELIQRS
jgi:hypothetical protein